MQKELVTNSAKFRSRCESIHWICPKLQFEQWTDRFNKIRTCNKINTVLLDFEWLKRCWFANGPDFAGIWNLAVGPVEIWRNGHHLIKNHLKFEKKISGFQMVQFSNGLGNWKLQPDPLKTGPFEIQSSKSSGFKCFRILDPHSTVGNNN